MLLNILIGQNFKINGTKIIDSSTNNVNGYKVSKLGPNIIIKGANLNYSWTSIKLNNTFSLIFVAIY